MGDWYEDIQNLPAPDKQEAGEDENPFQAILIVAPFVIIMWIIIWNLYRLMNMGVESPK